jgi:hypothetical protein
LTSKQALAILKRYWKVSPFNFCAAHDTLFSFRLLSLWQYIQNVWGSSLWMTIHHKQHI